MSSSDAAFDHNLAAEIAHLLGEHSVTIMIDLWKCFETIPPAKILEQAMLLNFTMKLAWMCIQVYYQPRTIQAYGSYSQPYASARGIVSGCSHATTLLVALSCSAVQRARMAGPTVQPRALVDDITLHWVGAKLARCVALRRIPTQYVQELQDLKTLTSQCSVGDAGLPASVRVLGEQREIAADRARGLGAREARLDARTLLSMAARRTQPVILGGGGEAGAGWLQPGSAVSGPESRGCVSPLRVCGHHPWLDISRVGAGARVTRYLHKTWSSLQYEAWERK